MIKADCAEPPTRPCGQVVAARVAAMEGQKTSNKSEMSS